LYINEPQKHWGFLMKKKLFLAALLTVIVLTVHVSALTVDCTQANALDPTGICNDWQRDPTGAHNWGHVMDLGTVTSNADVYFEIQPGAGDIGCHTTGYMYDSPDGTTWNLFWSQPDLAGWTRYSDTVHVADSFRYIRANTNSCSVDWSSVTVNINPNQPPVADFTYSPANPVIGQEITFTATQDTNNPIKTFSWDFKDGTGQGQQKTHTYKKVGWYSVNLLVTDYHGKTNSVTKLVEVRPKVAISGDTSAILQVADNGIITSPPIKLSADVNPKGGTFSWSVIKGQDKVTINSATTTKTVSLKGVNPSDPPGEDIEVRVIYVYNGVTNEAITKLTMRKPSKLMDYKKFPPKLQKNGNGDIVHYTVVYWYFVNDQMGNYIEAKLSTREHLSLLFSNDPKAEYSFDLKDATPKNGKVVDTLSPWWQSPDHRTPLPKNYLMRYRQDLWINGFLFDEPRCIEYRYDDATSTPGLCPLEPF
jgi:PKD repeat protein